ncbi:sugar kinase [Enterococcus cecorum]|uniref:Sugar kinase n=1 Tax=Enterococcus cecorum TaxID=44008 RepID=A0A7X9RLG0_9ENTE|nr:sugar kinase [Enterococcus cecorum]MDY2955618.1 sugar kinase [Enterococcus cecorum]MDZ5502889.1 sugar kinase [Enterococcus cecorum]MDZ5509791.1 sugar kinase [Enterococcus cecorum]MDZ5556828.1 sugar kinase [Enterococcus cecorum]MDZ5558746.1 sugar kinase [Enterococcus cecorum]
MAKVLTLGEIMLRLSTVESRLAETSEMQAHYGGGEANVAISLANFGHQAYFASKVPDNALGLAVKHHLNRFGVHTDYLLFGGQRLGIYFLEQGFGIKAANVVYDRAYSSFSQMKENEWERLDLFAGIDLFHLSGITPALSPAWVELLIKLMQEAKSRKVKISFDINFRGKLWSQAQASVALKQILPYVDYLSAGKLDAQYLLGIENAQDLSLEQCYQEIKKRYPNIQVIYSTNRTILSAKHNQLQGTIYSQNQYYKSEVIDIPDIIDRVGGGDAYSAGILHGLLSGYSAQEIVNFATAASALKHMVYGDCNQFTLEEVQAYLKNGSSKINR